MPDDDLAEDRMPLVVVEPSAVLGDGVPPDVAGASIVANPDAGTLTWTPDSVRARSQGVRAAPLPGRGSGAVDRLVVAGYVHGDPMFGGVAVEKLLFLDGDERCLWTSRSYKSGTLLRAWPGVDLARLEMAGVRTSTEVFRTAAALDRRYPGAARAGRWASPSRLYTIAIAVALILVVIVFRVA
jgi:hypothetical protein